MWLIIMAMSKDEAGTIQNIMSVSIRNFE